MPTYSFDTKAASQLVSALANPQRLRIVCLLLDGEWDVGSLADKIGLSQSALSQHLKILRDGDLVSTRRVAQTVFYSSTSTEAAQLIQALQELLIPEEQDRRHAS